ncbi:hypothetical protein BGZ94_008908 [Podila epigama]|nr:hypothetical protein BGZ94_008908 [Podila epigama]
MSSSHPRINIGAASAYDHQNTAAAYVREYTSAVQHHQQQLQQQLQQQQQQQQQQQHHAQAVQAHLQAHGQAQAQVQAQAQAQAQIQPQLYAKSVQAYQTHLQQQLPPMMLPPPSPNTLSYYYHQDRGWLRLERSGSVDAHHHRELQRARLARGSISDHQYLDSILRYPAGASYDDSQSLMQQSVSHSHPHKHHASLHHPGSQTSSQGYIQSQHQLLLQGQLEQQQHQQHQQHQQLQSQLQYQTQRPAAHLQSSQHHHPGAFPPHVQQLPSQHQLYSTPAFHTQHQQQQQHHHQQLQHLQLQQQQQQQQQQQTLQYQVQPLAQYQITQPQLQPQQQHHQQQLKQLQKQHQQQQQQQQIHQQQQQIHQQQQQLQVYHVQPTNLYLPQPPQLRQTLPPPEGYGQVSVDSYVQAIAGQNVSQQLQLQQHQLQQQAQAQAQQQQLIQMQHLILDQQQRQGQEHQQHQRHHQQKQKELLLAAAVAQQQPQELSHQVQAASVIASGPLTITKVIQLPQTPKAPMIVQVQPADGKSQQLVIDPREEEWRDHLLAYAHMLYASEASNPPPSSPLVPILQTLTSLHKSHLPTFLLLACVHYTRRDYELSLHYNHLILSKDPNYVEAMSNIGTTLRSLGRQSEAESWWWKAVRLRPGYWDAFENLIGVLCSGYGATEASNQTSNQTPASQSSSADSKTPGSSQANPKTEAAGASTLPQSQPQQQQQQQQPPRYKEALKICEFVEANVLPDPTDPTGEQPPPLPIQHTPRLQNLLYAKGNLKYALGDVAGARREYERSLEIVFGQGIGAIQVVTEIMCRARMAAGYPRPTARDLEGAMLLLRPEEALQVTQVVFQESGGVLPGLAALAATCSEGGATGGAQGGVNTSLWHQANQTTSTVLLTLAKLYQDVLDHPAKAKELVGPDQVMPTISTLLPMYYLSLALNPSPSTCNNLGILLSSIPPTAKIFSYPAPAQPMQLQVQSNGLVVPAPAAPAYPVTGQALALQFYNYGLQLDPRHPHLYTNLGSLLKDMGQLNEAVAMYEKAVECNPRFDVALANLGNAIKDLGKVQESIQWYLRAVEINPGFSEAVCGLVNALGGVCDWRGRGGVGPISVSNEGRLVILNNPNVDKPLTSGWMGRVSEIVEKQLTEGAMWGTGLVKVFHQELSQLILRAFLDSNPQHPAAFLWQSRLSGWLGRSDNKDRRNEGGWIIRLIERATRRLQRKWYLEKYNSKTPHLSRRPSVEVREMYRRPMLPNSMTAPPVPTVLPFHTFTYPLTARQIRLISHRNALRISHGTLGSRWLPATVYPPPAPPVPRLKIGYVSSDFNNHPLSHLMQSVFGMHDKTRFEIFCYATTPADQTPYRVKIQSEAEHFLEVSTWSTQAIVERIVADGIHVLVNLNGYTKGARNEVFAARPCPVQVSFMGFAGTLGAGWCDWIVADPIVCPPELVTCVAWKRKQRAQLLAKVRGGRQNSRRSSSGLEKGNGLNVESDSHLAKAQAAGQFSFSDFEGDVDPEDPGDDWVYTEKFIYMPHSYFVNDHRQGFREEEKEQEKRLLLATEPNLAVNPEWSWILEHDRRWQMRKELFPGLAENTVIFANFNQLYKIDPTIFKVWLKILARVPNAILWLLRFPAAGEPHLLRTATEWAGPSVASRVIFTDVAPKQVHIHRGRIADLFLDTPECNAHTTAADILWSGTPILTFPKYGHKMCSRVGASIAYATGYGNEMVVSSEEEYEERAVSYAQDCRWEYVEDSVLKQSLGLASSGNLAAPAAAFHPTSINGGALHPQFASQGPVAGLQSVVHWIGRGRLIELRRKLWENRDQSLLFDTLRWTRNLEKGLAEAWRRWETGQEFDEIQDQNMVKDITVVDGQGQGRRRSSTGPATLFHHQHQRQSVNGNISVKSEHEHQQHEPLQPLRSTSDEGHGYMASADALSTAGARVVDEKGSSAETPRTGVSINGHVSSSVGAMGLDYATPTHPLSLPPLGQSGTNGSSDVRNGGSNGSTPLEIKSSVTGSQVDGSSSNGVNGSSGHSSLNGIPEGRVELGGQSEPRRGSRGGGSSGMNRLGNTVQQAIEKLEQQIKRPDLACIFVCD